MHKILGVAAAQVQVPTRAINSDAQPTHAAANRQYFKDFDFKIVPGVGHYPMLEKAEAFNHTLAEILRESADKKGSLVSGRSMKQRST